MNVGGFFISPDFSSLPYCITLSVGKLYHCRLFRQIYPYVSVLSRAIYPYSELRASPSCYLCFWPRPVKCFCLLDHKSAFVWQGYFKPAVTSQTPYFRYPSVTFFVPSAIDGRDFSVPHTIVSVCPLSCQGLVLQHRTCSLPLRLRMR